MEGEVRCADGGRGGVMWPPTEDASSHQEPEEAGRVVPPGAVQPCELLDAGFPTCRLGENTFLKPPSSWQIVTTAPGH